MPLDDHYRVKDAHLMSLIGQANRIRLFNTALGVSMMDLSPYPTDFVAAVCEWQSIRENPDED